MSELTTWTPERAAAYVSEAYNDAVSAVIETGRRLNEVKARVGHGMWLPTVELLPFSEQTARKFMQISEHPELSNRAHVRDLPASWGTLAVLAQLPAGKVSELIDAAEISPDTTRAEAQKLVKEARQPAPNSEAVEEVEVSAVIPPEDVEDDEPENTCPTPAGDFTRGLRMAKNALGNLCDPQFGHKITEDEYKKIKRLLESSLKQLERNYQK